jgi:UDP-glucose 4-epimerase
VIGNIVEKVLITGVAGFIGSYVAARFLCEGYQVVGVDDLSNGNAENVPKGVQFINGDLSLKTTINDIPRDCSYILHLSGQSSGEISFDDPVADLNTNAVSTVNLIRYGINNNARRIIYASSMSVYGNVENQPIKENHACAPLSCYGVGKFAAENYLRVYQHQIPYVAMRMFNVYGPGQDLENMRQGMVSIFLAQALETGRIEVKGSIERFRDFIYIDDVVEAWFRATTYSNVNNIVLNIGTGAKTTVNELLRILKMLVPGAEYYIQGATPGDQSGIFADNSELKKTLNLTSFRPLDSGLANFCEWAKQSKMLATKTSNLTLTEKLI